jgi:hypothetical protein
MCSLSDQVGSRARFVTSGSLLSLRPDNALRATQFTGAHAPSSNLPREEDGIAVFDRIRYRRHDGTVFMLAFDLIELNVDDLRREPLERRKAALAKLLRSAGSGVQLNEHLEADGVVLEHACRMGLEGIVSKRNGSPYRSGRSEHWVKAKNPGTPAVTQLAEENWGWPNDTRRPSRR